MTVKKCMPVFDSLTAGYIIKTYTDVLVTQKNGAPYYQWKDDMPILFHDFEQAEHHPLGNGFPYPKWNSPWAIKTPNGYSCIFIPPMNNPNNIFTIIPGIVDTDSFNSPVNFPFVLDDPLWEGVIPAGTSIAQVIPFKRDSFDMKIGNKKDIEQSRKNKKLLNSMFFSSYKNQFWNKKSFN